MEALVLFLGSKPKSGISQKWCLKVQFCWTKKRDLDPLIVCSFCLSCSPLYPCCFHEVPFAEAVGSLFRCPGQVWSRRPALSERWEDAAERCSSGTWNAAGLCLSQCGRIVGQHSDIKMQLNCSTDLNTEMVPVLKNKASLKQSNEEMCVNTNYGLLKKSLWRQRAINATPAFAEETLQHRHILVS